MKMKLRFRQIIILLVVAFAVAWIFLSYLQPSFMLDLANRYILCS